MKKLLKVVVVLVLLVLVIGFAGLMFLDQAVKAAVEKGGTYAMGVETELGSADIALLKGQFGLDSLRVANPAGFKDPSFLTLGKGELEVELGSLIKDTVVVPRFLLSDLTLDIERNDSGTNFQAILANLQRFEGAEQPPGEEKPEEPAPPSEGGGGKNVLLKEVVIRDVTVKVDIGKQIAGYQNTSFTLPELVITDLGTGGEGKPISQHFSDILQRLLDEVVKNGAGLIPPELLEDLKGKLASLEGLEGELKEKAQEKLDELEQKARDELKGLQDDVQKKLDETLQQGGAAADDQKKQLGDEAKKKLGDGLGDLWKKQDGDGE